MENPNKKCYIPILRPHRLIVRTQASQAWNSGAIPGEVTKTKQAHYWAFLVFVTTAVMFCQ